MSADALLSVQDLTVRFRTDAGWITAIEEIGFDASFSFVYSPRPGTPAAALEDDTPQSVKLERLHELQHKIDAHALAISESMVGTTQRVLVEGPARRNAEELAGRTGDLARAVELYRATIAAWRDMGRIGRFIFETGARGDELLARARAGDRPSFGELVRRHQRAALRDVAVDPKRPERVYAGAERLGLVRSEDGGFSWGGWELPRVERPHSF